MLLSYSFNLQFLCWFGIIIYLFLVLNKNV